jgi:hypothetical protein
MAHFRQWHGACLTFWMRKKIARLFTIKTRFEALLVIYAIALGAVERGVTYLETYPGALGWLLFAACTGVVFIAGAKLLDAVRPAPPQLAPGPYAAKPRSNIGVSRSRPSSRRSRDFGSALPISLRKD